MFKAFVPAEASGSGSLATQVKKEGRSSERPFFAFEGRMFLSLEAALRRSLPPHAGLVRAGYFRSMLLPWQFFVNGTRQTVRRSVCREEGVRRKGLVPFSPSIGRAFFCVVKRLLSDLTPARTGVHYFFSLQHAC